MNAMWDPDAMKSVASELEPGDHYAVLELNSNCSREDIREAYYFLARRYHPDRFRAGYMRDLLGRIEAFFTQVTEAYNTLLLHSKPSQRTSSWMAST